MSCRHSSCCSCQTIPAQALGRARTVRLVNRKLPDGSEQVVEPAIFSVTGLHCHGYWPRRLDVARYGNRLGPIDITDVKKTGQLGSYGGRKALLHEAEDDVEYVGIGALVVEDARA